MKTFRTSQLPGQEAGKVVILFGGIVLVLVGGTLGYVVIEGWSVLEALYMTVITISTVGFKEIQEPSNAGRVFTVMLILGGASMMLYGLTTLLEFVVGGQLSGMYRRRALSRQLDKLEGHYVLCGYGRVGRTVAEEFESYGVPFVVVDSNPNVREILEEEGRLYVIEEASDDEVLERVGIQRARGLVAAVDSDADNMYVVLSARTLNPSLQIVARANVDASIHKLRKAGADQVISPYGIGGKKMAALLVKPTVSDYLDVVTGGGQVEFRLEEFVLNNTCDAVGKSIGELEIRRQAGATILGVKNAASGVFDTNPSPDHKLRVDDVLIAIGTPEDIAGLEELFACSLPPA